jgi:hypothetical protein
MKIAIDVRYPAIGKRKGLRGATVAVFDTTHTETVELDIRECTDVADVPAFSIDAAAVLPSSRVLHDPKATMVHMKRPWMAVVEKEGREEEHPPVRRIGAVLEHAYAGIVERHGRARTSGKERALFDAIAKEIQGWAQDFTIFGDGRIYQADVVPVYEIKGVYSPSVSIVPSSTPSIASAQYFGPDERTEAEACFRQMLRKAGIQDQYRMPMIMSTSHAPETEIEMDWALKDAVRRVVASLRQGIDSEYSDRWMDRIGGEGFAALVASASSVASDHDVDLEKSTQAIADFWDALRSRLKLPPQDPSAEALEILRARIDDAWGLVRAGRPEPATVR